MKEGQTPGPWERVVWVTGWGPAPSTLLSSSPRSQDLGRRQRGAAWRREGSKDNSRRTSSVQYGRLSHYYYNIL